MQPTISIRASSLRSSAIRDLLANARLPGMLSLAGGLPEPSSFPNERLMAAASVVLAREAGTLQYAPSEGDERLRHQIAAIESERRAGPVDAATVLVTTGSQQALALVSAVIGDPGDLIAVPHPCYLGALQTFAAAGLVAHPVLASGGRLDLDRLEAELRSGTRIAALSFVANHGNPDGYRVDDATNRRLAGLSEEFGFWIIEDDPYRELWFDAAPVPSIAAHAANAITLGSFSKTFAPGLRVGWLTAPAAILGPLVRTKQSADLHTSSLSQALIAELLAEPGWYAAHTAELRALYAERCAVFCEALQSTFGERISFTRPTGGMFTWARLDGVDTTALLAEAITRSVLFVPGEEFAVAPETLPGWLRLSYATLGPTDLVEAVRRLASAVEALDTGVDRALADA